ncbi:MAG: endonuclease/exonuclease/phosphatase family protein [Trueperella sp.]|nr:endonuclease/exonuclease/phosphatase family protein [Trueperella sp.]
MKFFRALIAILIAILAGISLFPGILPLETDLRLVTPFSQLVALRPWLALGFIALGVVIGVVSLLRYKIADAGRIGSLLAVVLLLVGAAHGTVVITRGISDPAGDIAAAQADPAAISVLTYNTLGGETSPDDIAQVVLENDVDVVVLPETSTRHGLELAAQLERAGADFQFFDTETDPAQPEFSSTVLLVAQQLGEYRVGGTQLAAQSSISVVPVNGSGPQIVAVHPMAPVPGWEPQWESDITEVYGLCSKANGPLLVAGDFNSTADHQAALDSTCADAGQEAGIAGLGTWPAGYPALLGAPIDRVLHNSESYRGVAAKLIEVGKSDHRGLLVWLVPNAA